MATFGKRKKPQSAVMRWSDAVITSMVALAAIAPVAVALYLMKSALGVNLMAGPSPLHDILYSFAR